MQRNLYQQVRKLWQSQNLIVMAALLLCILCTTAFAAPPPVTGTVQTSLGWGFGSDVTYDPAGDLFFMVINGSGAGQIMEVPAGSVAVNGQLPITTLTATAPCSGWSCGRIATDASNNVYFVDQWNSHIWKLARNADGSYAAPAAIGTSGYYNRYGLAIDAAGDLYFSDWSNTIYKSSLSNSSATPTVVSSSLATSAQKLAVSKAGDIYWADDTNKIYMIPASATLPATPTLLGSGYNKVTAVSFDINDNLYIVDNGANLIYEVRRENGTLNFSNQFIFSAGASITYSAGLAFDTKSHTFELANNGQLVQIADYAAFGSSPLGVASSALSINYAFNDAATPTISTRVNGASSSEFVTATGSTCTSGTAYTASSSCVLNLTFTPSKVGNRTGAVVFTSASGTILGETPVGGIGNAPGLALDPAVQATSASNLHLPAGLAVDDAGDILVVDSQSNSVLAIPQGGTTATTVATGFNSPTAVALNGAGDLIVADTGNKQVVEVPFINGAYSTANQVVLGSGFQSPVGVAVDNTGNIYVADSEIKAVTKLMPAGYGYTQTTLGNELIAPSAVAVDGSGNIYVADSNAKSVTKISADASAQVTVATNLLQPNGVAVDASGSVYISDSGKTRIVYVPFNNSSFGAQLDAFGLLVSAQGVAIDAQGNLYASDSAAPAVYNLARSNAVLNFGKTNVGTLGDTLNATIYNIGNLPLAFTGTPVYTATGIGSDFLDVSAATTGCTSSSSVVAGASCVVSEQFTPTTAATLSGTLTLQNDAANSSNQTITVTGVGVSLPATTTALALTAPASGTPTYGDTVQVTATVAPQSGTETPTGTVSFKVDGTVQPDVTLSSNGTASFSQALAGGAHSVTAKYSGDLNFASSLSSALSVQVAPASTTVALASSPTSFSTLDAPTLTATVSSTVSGVIAGTITFSEVNSDGSTTALGTGSISQNSAGAYVATLSTKLFSVGTHTLIVSYGGSTNFALSTSAKITVTATPPADFTLGGTPSSVLLSAGAASVYTLPITTAYGFSNPVTLSCTMPLTGTACVFTVNGVITAGTVTITPDTSTGTPVYPASVLLRVAAEGPSASIRKSAGFYALAIMIPSLFGLVLFPAGRKLRTSLKLSGFLLLLSAVLTLASCGSSTAKTTPYDSGAATGSGTATLIVTNAGTHPFTHSYTFTLTVK